MNASRGKLVTFSAVATGLIVLGAAVAQKDRLLEQWYLYRLERANEKENAEEARRAIAGLGEVGRETALIKLFDLIDRDPIQKACDQACEEISDRIRETRLFMVVTKYTRDSEHHPRSRVEVAMVPFNLRYHLNQSREIAEAKEAAVANFSELLDSEDETASLIAAACFNDLGESHLANLSNAARETVKTEKQRAIKLLRARRVTDRLASPP
jgi:hypothetical protein